VTGVEEMRHIEVVSAAPRRVAVSVLGGRTQLDVNLPADVPAAALLPELAELISSRDDASTGPRDERRTFWRLGTLDGRTEIRPDQTLDDAGVVGGEVLVITARRSLSPPTLYDDVVDAAARLNRASFAAWSSEAARWMAFVGVWGSTAVLVWFLWVAQLSAHRDVVAGFAVAFAVALIASATLAQRGFRLSDVGTALSWPAVALAAVVGWTIARPHGAAALAIACLAVFGLLAVCRWVVGIGPWLQISCAVIAGAAGVAAALHEVGVGVDVLAAAAATVATFACLSVPAVTRDLARHHGPDPTPRKARGLEVGDLDGAGAFPLADDAQSRAIPLSGVELVPTAEDVWARAHRATAVRSAVTAGFATAAAASAMALLDRRPGWAAFVFALVVAAVLAVRCTRVASAAERAALLAPAVAVVLAACLRVQDTSFVLGAAALVVLTAMAGAAAAVGLANVRLQGRWRIAASYLDYVLVATLIPFALWPLGIYDRMIW
jgi:type VII secretion integral membrane protein EccD